MLGGQERIGMGQNEGGCLMIDNKKDHAGNQKQT